MKRIAFLVLMAATTGPAAAQEVDCENAMAQSDMTQCAHDAWMVADEDLNAAYKEALAMLREVDAGLPEAERGAVEALKAAQRAWITFRDQACLAEGYLMHGGSAEPMLVYGCMATLTSERAVGLWMLATPM